MMTHLIPKLSATTLCLSLIASFAPCSNTPSDNEDGNQEQASSTVLPGEMPVGLHV